MTSREAKQYVLNAYYRDPFTGDLIVDYRAIIADVFSNDNALAHVVVLDNCSMATRYTLDTKDNGEIYVARIHTAFFNSITPIVDEWAVNEEEQ